MAVYLLSPAKWILYQQSYPGSQAQLYQCLTVTFQVIEKINTWKLFSRSAGKPNVGYALTLWVQLNCASKKYSGNLKCQIQKLRKYMTTDHFFQWMTVQISWSVFLTKQERFWHPCLLFPRLEEKLKAPF